MNVLLKVSAFLIQSNSSSSISKINYSNQVTYLEQLRLKLLKNQDFFPIISIFITEVSHKKQWYELALAQTNLAREENLHQPPMLWVANRNSLGKLIKKLFINDHFFAFTRVLVLDTVS